MVSSMIVRDGQMRTMRDNRDPDLRRRVARYLQLRYPALFAGIDDPAMVELAGHAIGRARTYGLTWESSLVRFADLMCAFAPNFDTQRGIHARLTNPAHSPEDRLEAVYNQTVYTEWMEACRNYDPFAWGIDMLQSPELLERRGEARDR